MIKNVLIAGVGGQGILLISNVLGEAAIGEGYGVRGSETHGMAQRGGSVVSHVRIGEACSPLIPRGEADYLLALEPLEALRYLDFLGEDCTALVSTYTLVPAMAQARIGRYPPLKDIIQNLEEHARVLPLDAVSLAREAGSTMAGNTVMMGALSTLEGFPLRGRVIEDVLLGLVPPKTREINSRAFSLGKEFLESD